MEKWNIFLPIRGFPLINLASEGGGRGQAKSNFN
jgi:hypothetical protein